MRESVILFILLLSVSLSGQTATDFTVTSCGGVNHNLFNALDTGKIVLLTWVKPESANANFVASAYSIVQEFEITNPNRVSLFICDDYSNTSCSALNGWMVGKTFSQCTSFSDNSIKMSDYNLNGVPKIAVIANTSHYVFDVQVNTLNDSALREVIRSIIIGPVSQADSVKNYYQIRLTPNPANNLLNIQFNLNAEDNPTLNIFNLDGKRVRSVTPNYQKGVNSIQIETQTLPAGTYFFRISNGKKEDSIKFMVLH